MRVGVDQTGHKGAACRVEDLFPLFFFRGRAFTYLGDGAVFNAHISFKDSAFFCHGDYKGVCDSQLAHDRFAMCSRQSRLTVGISHVI